MAIGDPYVTLSEAKDYLSIPDGKTSLNAALTSAIDSCSREIEQYCSRQFNQDTVATTRVYEPFTLKQTDVDDFWTLDGMIVKTDPGGIGDFSVTWDPADFEVRPYNGVVAGVPGWPFNELRACRGLYFPKYAPNPYRRRAVVQVTAQWGWPAVPPPVKQACLMMMATTFEVKGAPLGVAGMSNFGAPIRVRDNPMAKAKLAPYVYQPAMVG